MKRVIVGLLLMLIGIILGLYVGVWVMFVGGIVQIINSVNAGVIVIPILLGLVRIFLASALGGFSFVILFVPGLASLQSGLNKK